MTKPRARVNQKELRSAGLGERVGRGRYAGDVDKGGEIVDEGGDVCVGLLQQRLLLLHRRRRSSGRRARGGAGAAAGLAHCGGG
jgi:hypothetical protein